MQCGTVSTYPIPDAATIKAHYAKAFKDTNYKNARVYADQYLTIFSQLATVLKDRLRETDDSLQGKRVLDIGCFTGEFLALLKKEGADVYGLELQPEAVRIANEKLPGRIFQADVSTHRFPQTKYDIVTLLGVVEHVPDPRRLLRRSAALLKRGGLVMVQTPNSSSLLAKALDRFWPPYAPVEHIHLFSKRGLDVALADAGFERIWFQSHWKRLPVGYVYDQFQVFGPEFRTLLKPFDTLLRSSRLVLPLYVGEMIMVARKQ